MTPSELREFMAKYELNPGNLAELLGVTRMAVINWLGCKRAISLNTARLIRLFDRRPELMREFVA